ncbi:MAG: LytTR family transcriptional regulator DNA-binding domain-containing protein [Lewinella sp.]|nr:LytTR family transcriptional regulator DNA-binding domain-containing protein [Lewinella sp.]
MLQKVVIVDDEAPARQLLREYLSDHPELVVVGEANNGVDAVRRITELRPEIIFLDVQMPGLSGLEVLAQLEEVPLVIFSTAYDQYALKAFELHAVDYLLKPLTRQRFIMAVDRLYSRLDRPQEGVRTLTQEVADQQAGAFPSKILVTKGSRLIAIQTKDIVHIRAEGDYSMLITPHGQHLSQYGIGQLEQKLSPRHFMRIHRSTIINLDAIAEIFKAGHTYDVRLHNGDTVKVSRSYAGKVKDMIF